MKHKLTVACKSRFVEVLFKIK